MAEDKGGGSALLIAVLIGVVLAVAEGGLTSTQTTTETTTGTTTGSTATTSPGGASTTTVSSSSTVVATSSSGTAPPPLSSCPGRVVGQQTANDLTVRVYYDTQSGGLNCVSAVHNGPVTPPGYLQTEIRIADYTGTSWPQYASKTGAPGAAEVSGAYLIETAGKCVTASSTYYPSGAGGGSTISVSLSGIGCR